MKIVRNFHGRKADDDVVQPQQENQLAENLEAVEILDDDYYHYHAYGDDIQDTF